MQPNGLGLSLGWSSVWASQGQAAVGTRPGVWVVALWVERCGCGPGPPLQGPWVSGAVGCGLESGVPLMVFQAAPVLIGGAEALRGPIGCRERRHWKAGSCFPDTGPEPKGAASLCRAQPGRSLPTSGPGNWSFLFVVEVPRDGRRTSWFRHGWTCLRPIAVWLPRPASEAVRYRSTCL